MLAARGVRTDDIEHVPGGKTFFWRGHYDYDLNVAHTDDTQLNVFGDFQPKLSDQSKALGVRLPGQHPAGPPARGARAVRRRALVGLDSMNLWIDTARDSLVRAISAVDLVLMNDAELRMLTEQPNLVRAARDVMAMGRAWWSPSRASTAPRCSPRRASSRCPGYPLEEVVDPTGAGDSFAGGFLGYLDAIGPRTPSDDQALRRAMTYGSVMASFNVEQFGTERVQSLTHGEINRRFEEFKLITHLEAVPLELRALRIGLPR